MIPPLGCLRGSPLRSTGIKSRLMSDLHPPDDTSASSPSNPPVPAPVPAKNDAMFAGKPPAGGGIPVMAWGVAGLAVLVVIVVLVPSRQHQDDNHHQNDPTAGALCGEPA